MKSRLVPVILVVALVLANVAAIAFGQETNSGR